jgi:CDGSH-type Zn-finger protein
MQRIGLLVQGKKQPHVVKLPPGNYLWCACGRSQRPPYCDGSHAGSTISPVRIEQREPGEVKLCGCKQSGTKPYCDCSHEKP